MGKVKVYHSRPRDLQAVQPQLLLPYSVSLASGEKCNKTCWKPDYYTGAPWKLVWDDTILFFQNFFYLKNIVFPLWNSDGRAFPSKYLDELYPSLGNIHDIVFHSILIIIQSAFILSLPFLAALPFPVLFGYIGIFIAVNQLACWRLNGDIPHGVLKSTDFPDCNWDCHHDEKWVFLNGVAVGKHWLQGNIDRLSLTFHRPVWGVHNKTSGIIFDVIQCLLERCLYFGTTDTRTCFAIISKFLRDDRNQRVILILHSQGGLEGSIILDWLMNQHSQQAMQRLEIYTFGNAANHFNDPRTLQDEESHPMGCDARAVGHIEHYANSKDFVARWGVLHFKKETAESNIGATVCSKGTDHANHIRHYRKMRHDDSVGEAWNSYHGNLFERNGSGHQLNQHYLDNIFPLDRAMKGVEVTEDGTPLADTFMDMEVDVVNDPKEMDKLRGKQRGYKNQALENGSNGVVSKKKVYQLSRLWKYTNGRCPPEDCSKADSPIKNKSPEGRVKSHVQNNKNGTKN